MVLRHQRRTRFRWFGIVELLFGILVVFCLIPILIVAALLGGETNSGFELPSIRARFYHHWHEIVLTLLSREGHVLGTAVHAPASTEEGNALVAAVLSAAQREAVVVVETLAASDGDAGEVVDVWYGGRPLLSRPDLRPEDYAAAVLRQAGLDVEVGREQVVLAQLDKSISRFWAFVAFFFVLIPLSPILLFVKSGRRAMRESWDDVRGVDPPKRVITVRAESLSIHKQRGDRRWGEAFVDGASMLGITFSPTLGFDKDVTRFESSLRCVGERTTIRLPLSRAAECGTAVRDLLVASTLRMRHARPELGLLGPGPRPTRCPFCTGLYDMQPGSQCPYCGAPAGSI